MRGEAAVRGLGTPGSRGVSVSLLLPVTAVAGGVDEVLWQTAGLGQAVHPGLLEEFLCVQSVQRSQVVDDGQQLPEYGAMLWVLRYQDVFQNHLQLLLHFADELRVAQTGAVWKRGE